MEMFPSTPQLCHLHIYLIVPDTTGNKSAVRHAGSSSAASESRDLHQHLPTAPIKLPGKFSKACRAFPHLMVFSPSLQPLEAGISKVEKHHLHWPQRGRLKILRIFISPGTCSTSSPGSSDRLRTSVQTFSCLTELPNLPGSAWRRAESGGVEEWEQGDFLPGSAEIPPSSLLLPALLPLPLPAAAQAGSESSHELPQQ